MRLIHTSEQRLYEFTDHGIPPYAILSHTWGNNEITYHDFLQGKRTEKIARSCALAASEFWDYIWIDTCCIDKSSSAELSEAINSMYHWYQMAQVCYAYLEDVSVLADTECFSASRWFTRGWTLQELLAPTRVIFLDHAWRILGSKRSLEKEVSTATRIKQSQLAAPIKASAAAKMSWMSRRTTTRIEDMAYCLLGLFKVNIPLLYGEGERAFTRLQEEIIRQTDDQSIFAWIDRDLEYSGMLARHPSAFAESGDIEKAHNASYAHKNSYKMTNRGLKIQFPIFEGYYESGDAGTGDMEVGEVWRFEVPLECKRSWDGEALIFLTLKQYASGKSFRINLFELRSLELPKERLDAENKTFIVASGSSPSLTAGNNLAWATPKIRPTAAVQSYFPYFRNISGLLLLEMGEESPTNWVGSNYSGDLIFGKGDSGVDNKKLVLVDDREIISIQSETHENRAARFSGVNGDGFILYWWQSPGFLTPPAIKVCLVFQVELHKRNTLNRRTYQGIIKTGTSSRYSQATMHLQKLDVWTIQPSNIKGKSLYVRLRHEIHDQRQQLVIDVDVTDTLVEPRFELPG